MSRIRLILLASLGVIASAAIILMLVFLPHEPTDQGSSAVATRDPATAIPTTDPTSLAPDQAAEGVAPTPDGRADTIRPEFDVTPFRALAIAGLSTYLTYDSTTPDDVRRATLTAAGLADGVPLAPKLALPQLADTPDWSARTGVTGSPYATVSYATDQNVVLTVVLDYWGSYGTPETQSQQGRGTYTVTISHADGTAGLITGIVEPTYPIR